MGRMTDPARSLHEALRALEHRAVTTRQKVGLPSSRRAAADAAGKPPYATKVNAQRISSWVPADPALAQVPRAGDTDKVWALVRVWSDWAGERSPQQRYWMDLIEAAQPARARKPSNDGSEAEAFAGASPRQDAVPEPGKAAQVFHVQGRDRGVGIGTAEQVTIYQGPVRVTARSAYLQQVRRIAPPDPPGLIGREAELAELARFCLEPDRGLYVWWQGRAWAGKSALLSAFVLRPPPEVRDRVRIVSFFITARLAAQDTREAFTEVLLEQLADLTGQDLPPPLPEVTREAYLLDLLAQAAGACQDAGGRLVLARSVQTLAKPRWTTK